MSRILTIELGTYLPELKLFKVEYRIPTDNNYHNLLVIANKFSKLIDDENLTLRLSVITIETQLNREDAVTDVYESETYYSPERLLNPHSPYMYANETPLSQIYLD